MNTLTAQQNQNPTVEPAREKQTTVIEWGKLGTLALAISAPVFYLNGQAYHDGYLSYLNLESSMFPLQGTDFIGAAAVAWFRVIFGWFVSGFNSLGKHWLWALGTVVGLSLIFGGIQYLTGYLNEKYIPTSASGRPEPSVVKKTSFWRSWRSMSVYIFVLSYGLFAVLFLISSLLALTVSPFYDAGREMAGLDVKSRFLTSPRLMIKAPDADAPSEFRIIQCSTSFCAIFADGRAYTVPLSSINWAVSEIPGYTRK